MKAFFKLAVAGILAVAVNSPAFAATAQAAMESFAKSAGGRAVLQEMGLAVKSGAELNAALSSLGGAERSAVLAAIRQFNKQSAALENASADQSEALARSIFAQNGVTQMVAAKVQASASRDGMVNDATGTPVFATGETCNLQEAAGKLQNSTGLNSSEAEEALKSGVVVRGCKAGSEGILNMGATAKEVAARVVIAMKSLGLKGGEALAKVKNEMLDTKTTAAAEVANFVKLQSGECQVFNRALVAK